MKSTLLKLIVAALLCAGFSSGIARAADKEAKKDAKKEAVKKEAVPEEKKEPVTITGTAKAVPNKTDETKKHLEITDADGKVYIVISKAVTAEEVAKLDGKKVTATGGKYQKEGSKKISLFAKEIAEAK